MKRGGGFTTLLLVALFAWPFLPGVPNDFFGTAILACEYLVAALSLVLLIGFVGQISLCQAALIGVGAFVSALAVRKGGVHFPATLLVGVAAGAFSATVLGVVALRVRGLYLAVATMIFAYVCDQYLFAQPWLVETQSGTSIPFESIGRPNTIPYFDLGDKRVLYYVALAVAILALYLLANLRDSKIGRAFAALRGSEVAAASLGIDVVRMKLVGFACAGALAGLTGALTLVADRTVAPEQFQFTKSLDFLAIAVVGGLRSLGGAISSALLFAGLTGEAFFRWPALSNYIDLISATLLIGVLLFFRGGAGALPQRLAVVAARLAPYRERARTWLASRGKRTRHEEEDGRPSRQPAFGVVAGLAAGLSRQRSVLASGRRALVRGRRRDAEPVVESAPASPVDVVTLAERLSAGDRPPEPIVLHVERPASPHDDALHDDRTTQVMNRLAAFGGEVAGEPSADGRRSPRLLLAEGITVKFGGLTAVSQAGLEVGAGEIVGLIGPNGAGKTTLFNSILGLNQPVEGHVELYGRDVTGWAVHQRARLGVGRTFQIIQLFSDLTVFDNLLVATHVHNASGLWGNLVTSGRARRFERASRSRVRAVLRLMELEDVADRRVGDLPFGVLRLVEVARTMVTGARLVCFDEPASGLDSSETERLLQWFEFLRQIGITLLVIEHDVNFVVRLCDWIYVLDQGRLLASGPPARIQRDPAVIASYLGAPMEVA